MAQRIKYLTVLDIQAMLQDTEETYSKLVEWGLVPAEGSYRCPRCNGLLKLNRDSGRADCFRWVCRNKVSMHKKKAKVCSQKVEFRKGTFFARSKLPLLKILGFVTYWVQSVPLTVIGRQLKMSMSTTIDWASFCREIVFDAFFTQPEKLGGPDKVVEIGESNFGRRKYYRGERVEGQWVFGGYERGSGRVFMVAVENRDSETLVPLIEKWISAGTTIISDGLKAYSGLNDDGYKHLTINRSSNFKDPVTGEHINAIQSCYRAAKSSMPSYGETKGHVPGSLARYMFQKRCKELGLDPALEFFRLAGKLYDPVHPRPDGGLGEERDTDEEYEDDQHSDD